MITKLKEVANQFDCGILGEKEFLGLVIQIIGEKYQNFPDVEKYSNDEEVKTLSDLLNV